MVKGLALILGMFFLCFSIYKVPRLVGKYTFCNFDSSLYMELKICNGHLFYFKKAMDLGIYQSTGNWRINKDTLYLSSAYSKTGFEISAISTGKNEGSKRILLLLKKGTLGQISVALFSKDSIDYVAFEDSLYVNPDVFNRFQVVINNSIYSKIYDINNTYGDKLLITLPKYPTYHNYLFVDDKKFLIKENFLLSLNEYNRVDSVLSGLNLSSPLVLKKYD